MNEEKVKIDGISEKEFSPKWDLFQFDLIKEMEKGSFYKNDDERREREMEIADEFGEKFREIVTKNNDIKSAIMSGDNGYAKNRILEILNIRVAA